MFVYTLAYEVWGWGGCGFQVVYHAVIPNFVSAQYLENKFMEFDQILHMY